MAITITPRVRRELAIAACNRDGAEAYCDNLEAAGNVANTDNMDLLVPLPPFAEAGDDLTAFPLMSLDVGVTLSSVGLVAAGAWVGVDASNTVVVTVKDQAGNTIVTITYDDSTVPADNDVNDLGTLNGTHKVLTADEACTITVTCGATALPPDLCVLLVFHQ